MASPEREPGQEQAYETAESSHALVRENRSEASECVHERQQPDEAKGAERTPRWVLPAQCSTWMGVLDKSRHPAYIPPVA